MNLEESLRKIRSEELLSRFRSKEDLYKYMTNQRKTISFSKIKSIVGVYLHFYSATKISFIRSIIALKSKVIK